MGVGLYGVVRSSGILEHDLLALDCLLSSFDCLIELIAILGVEHEVVVSFVATGDSGMEGSEGGVEYLDCLPWQSYHFQRVSVVCWADF